LETILHNEVRIYDIASGQIKITTKQNHRVLSLAYVTEDLIAIAGEEKIIRIFDINSNNYIKALGGHTNRIRSLATIYEKEDSKTLPYLISICSDGIINVWNLNIATNDVTTNVPVLVAITKARLTTLAICNTDIAQQKIEQTANENPKKRKNVEFKTEKKRRNNRK